MNEKNGEGQEIPENITPIREGVIPKPNQRPQPDNPGRRKLFQAIAVAVGGVPLAKVLGEASNILVEPKKEPQTKPTNQPMKAFSNSPQYPPTPTEEDKRISDEYRQKHQQMLNNPDAPGSKIEGIQHPQSTATPYPNSPAHKIK